MHRYFSIARLAGVAAALPAATAVLAQSPAPVAQEFDRLHFRSIGPATMSGRIADFAVYEANPAIFYVGTSHGGVWKTTSKGALFTPLLQDKGLLSIGAVAVSQKTPDLIWVGTGESNNRQSTSWGDGIYKSTDGGVTFQNMGLHDSKHIGRIVIDPNNNDIVLVAAAGPLFGPGGDRGIYKTTDGGRTWKQVLKGDENTGANDITMSHLDPKVLYASLYQRRRTTCCVDGGGPGSGIWKSVDGGDTWTRLTGNGLPTGDMGRIALDVYRKSSNLLYASIETGRGGGGGAAIAVRGAALSSDTAAVAAGAVGAAGGRGGRGGRGGGGRGGRGGGAGAAAAPADSGADRAGGSGSGLYRSDDGGASWHFVSSNNPRPLYFSQVRVDPNAPDRVYMGGVKMSVTHDGGRTWSMQASLVAHDDIHAIWIDPNNSDHLLIGGDGGVYDSFDGSKTWEFYPNLPVGLFYHVQFDMEYPYNVCGGMQDNYDWCGPSASRHSAGIFNYDWFTIQGGDGFEAIPDLRDSRIVYTESQDGNLIRRNKVTGESKNIRPTPQNTVNAEPGEAGYRFHWDTPAMLSPNDPGTLLVGANRLFKSTDRGDSWTAISPDLTTGANRDTIVTMGVKGSDITISRDDGISQWPAIVAFAESPKQPGVYYTGTDDGVVSMSKDGGKTWQNITKHLPGFPTGFAFVSEVVPSRFDAATVYITVDNHRENDYAPHIWVSNDFGATFRSLVSNLAGENVRTLTEDTRNPDVLYIGTESGIFLSLDRGKSWRRLKANFPNVRVDELTIHPRDNSLIVATHGRAIWILDHLEPIQEYTAAQTATADAHLFAPPPTLEWKSKDDRNDEFWGHNYFIGENPSTEAVLQMYFKKQLTKPSLRISDASGARVRELPVPQNRDQMGIQTVCWDLRVDPISAGADSGAAPPGPPGRGGAGGGGGRGAQGASPIPGVPTPLPTAGYMPQNPCGGGGGGGGGGGRGGGGGPAGPQVLPGTYSVALLVDGKVVETKPLKVVMDPQVQLTDAQRRRYNEIVVDLHGLQQRGTTTAATLTALDKQWAAVAAKVKESSAVPAATKSEFDALNTEFTAIRGKFGVTLPDTSAAGAGGGRGGRGGRGGGRGGRGGNADADVLAHTASVKGAIMGIWEMPSEAMLKQYNDVKAEMPKAIADANAFMAKATAMSKSLLKYNITLMVPMR